MNSFSRVRTFQVAVVLFLFTTAGAWHFRHAVGEDLSSSYVGCRILAAGQGAHLYAHDPVIFSIVRDPVWNDIADQARFAPLYLLHPYVQTPLWAYSLQPVCTRTDFRTFCHIFLLLAMLCTSGTLWLVARYWVPALFHPAWMFLVCVGLSITDPFQYAMFLTQTHILYIFLSVLALILAQKDRPLGAGLALALAASVKITPGFLLIYWLLSRRYRAGLSFVGFSMLLATLTIVTTGPALFVAYLRELSEVSNVLLVAFNNQSLAAWWQGRIHFLPRLTKWASLALAVLAGVVGGSFDRNESRSTSGQPPYGAVFALVGFTMFTAIAWNHYYVLLVIPQMLLLNAMRKEKRVLWGGLAAIIYVLNLYPIAYGSILHLHQKHSIARSEFYSGIVCLVALALLRGFQNEAIAAGLIRAKAACRPAFS